MLKSMTGYGSTNFSDNGLSINVEVRTLNSKFLDLSLKLPKAFTEKELLVRNLVNDVLQRGKVSLSVEYNNQQETTLKQQYNEELFMKYYEQLKRMSDRVVAPQDELFKLALNSPDVIVNAQPEGVEEEDWERLLPLIKHALSKCDDFRAKEGAELQEKLVGYIQRIDDNLVEIEKLDPTRVQRIRDRIKGNLSDVVEEEGLDKNRLEQEIIYYIEKLDITEEKVRLKSHLDHFMEILRGDKSSGKKLGFISQEIGREINTIGSKANDAPIQKLVVGMKEELEKIKEQLLNVL
ncbi:MAG: YicC/YloC family endoribonuclease [Bacteroidota bacterium]